jgi:peptidoglycan-N-acetylglucosamine deacetylase
MLTFHNTVIAFIGVMLILVGYDYTHELSAMFYAVPAIAVVLAVSWGCYFIQSGFFLKAKCSGDRTKNEIALTFDDGPHEKTPVILDVLKRNNAKAAFFCIGKNIAGNENVLQRIVAEGHLVGNHSYSHSNLIDLFPLNMVLEDVAKADDLILRATGKKSRLFRPPYGVTTPVIAKVVRERKYETIGWDVRSYDTSIKSRDRLMKRIFRLVKNGSVILLHDSTPGIEIVLERVLEYAREKNLKIVSIEEMFRIKAYESA